MKFLLACLMLISIVNGSQELATIDKIIGKVKVLKSDAIRAKKAKSKQKLFKDDLLITYSNAMVTIKLDDESYITLDEKTKLRLVDLKQLKQESGTAFFNIETQGTHSVTVATNFATIGVKGTKFIINSQENKKDVSLKSGLIGVSALEGEFEIHKKKRKALSEYEKYKLAQENEFEEYKAKIEEEFIEYKKEFDLFPNHTVSFNKNVVNEKQFSSDIEEEFSKFEAFQH